MCIRDSSTGHGHIVLEAARMAAAGMAPEEIVQQLEALTARVDASFILEQLEYMKKGGRCSAVALLGANLLKLRPCIEVKDGKMGVAKKYRGTFAKCLEAYIADRLAGRDDICLLYTSTRGNTLCYINGRQLLLSNILHLLRYLDFRILERCAHREKRRAARRRVLPLRSRQCVQLCGRCAQHVSAQCLQLRGKLLLFRPIQKQAEIQVIGVHHGIYRYKIRDLQIAIPFIAAEKLGIKIRLDHK